MTDAVRDALTERLFAAGFKREEDWFVLDEGEAFMQQIHIDTLADLARAAALAAPVEPTPEGCTPAERTRSQKLAGAGFTRRPGLWALQAREALELIAAPMRPDGTWNRDREACRQLAAEALGRYDDVALAAPVEPQKARPDFIAGYDAGMADGKRIAERERAEAPVEPTVEPMTERDQFDLARWHKRLGELADAYYETGPTHPARERARAALLYHALECSTGWRARSVLADQNAAALAPADEPPPHEPLSPKERFDGDAFYATLARSVTARDVTWKEVSEQTGVSQTTLTRMSMGRRPDAASLAALSAWAGINPANYIQDVVRRQGQVNVRDIPLSAPADERQALAHFTDYFVRNYPGPHTIISDPKWHAPKIFRAAQYALEQAARASPAAEPKLLTDEEIDRAIERHVGGAELTDDDHDSMRTFARAIEAASRGKPQPLQEGEPG